MQKMEKIIVSADYFGGAILSARQHGVTAGKMANLLGCDVKKLHRYEAGTELIPTAVLSRIFRCAAKHATPTRMTSDE